VSCVCAASAFPAPTLSRRLLRATFLRSRTMPGDGSLLRALVHSIPAPLPGTRLRVTFPEETAGARKCSSSASFVWPLSITAKARPAAAAEAEAAAEGEAAEAEAAAAEAEAAAAEGEAPAASPQPPSPLSLLPLDSPLGDAGCLDALLALPAAALVRAWEAVLFERPLVLLASDEHDQYDHDYDGSASSESEQSSSSSSSDSSNSGSGGLRRLAPLALLLRSLLAPYLRYAHASVPLLPPAMLDILDAPFPFLVGVRAAAFLERVYGGPPPPPSPLPPQPPQPPQPPPRSSSSSSPSSQARFLGGVPVDRSAFAGLVLLDLDSGRLVDGGRSSDYGESGDSDEEEEEEEEEEEDDNSGHDDDEETDEDDDNLNASSSSSSSPLRAVDRRPLRRLPQGLRQRLARRVRSLIDEWRQG
jgi:hypothetical protein